MRWTSHPGRAVILAVFLMMIPGIAAAQTAGTPAATPGAEQPIWQSLDGVESAIVRSWGDVPPPGTPPPDGFVLRFLSGVVVQFDGESQAEASLDPVRDWMLASLQVNLVDVNLDSQVGTVENLGDNATVARAGGMSGDRPLTIAVVVVQDGDQLLVVGASVMADEDLLPIIENVVTVMLDGEPGGEIEQGEMGRYTGGNWSIFPEEDDPALEDMQRQGDVTVFQQLEALNDTTGWSP